MSIRDDISFFLQNRKQIEAKYKEKGYVAVEDKNVLAYSSDFSVLAREYPNAVIREIHSDFASNSVVSAEFVNGGMQSFSLEKQKEDKTYKVENDGKLH